MSRPRPEILMDRGNLIVKAYNPERRYTDKQGNARLCDSALVYTDMGSKEANEEAAKHAFWITAYSTKARDAMRRAAQVLNPDGREGQNFILPALLEVKIERNNNPTTYKMNADGEPELDAKGNKIKVDNIYYNKRQPVYRLTALNRNNQVDGLTFPKQRFAKVKGKDGQELTIARPTAYIKGASIIPAFTNPKGENGKRYTQQRDANGNPLENPITGRRLDVVVGDLTLRMFVPDSEIEKSKKFKDIFAHVDQTTDRRAMVVNFMAPLSFTYRYPLDQETKQPMTDKPKNVLSPNLGLATSIYILPMEEMKATASEDNGLDEAPESYDEEQVSAMNGGMGAF